MTIGNTYFIISFSVENGNNKEDNEEMKPISPK